MGPVSESGFWVSERHKLKRQVGELEDQIDVSNCDFCIL